MKPIKTHDDIQQPTMDLDGIKQNVEAQLTRMWSAMATGKTMYCEIHFILYGDGKYSDVSVWRSSGDRNYDQAAKSCIDQGSYGRFEGLEAIEVVATFKTEARPSDVTVRFPHYQGTDSKVDRVIAAKKQQEMNTIALMKQRIVAAQKVLGSDSPKLTQSINYMANRYVDVKEFQSAEAAFKWAISIREKANGPNSKELAESVSDLGEMYRLKGDDVSAEECFKRVLNMTGLKPCVELREAVHRYAKLCMYNKRKADADFLFKRENDIQSGAALDPIPANMIWEGPAKSDSDAAAGTKNSATPSDAAKSPAPADAQKTSPASDTSKTSKPADATDAAKTGAPADATKTAAPPDTTKTAPAADATKSAAPAKADSDKK
jgi:tetratricopeptide (TPR) repeat protein